MYKYELNTLLEKVLGVSYQMKNGENAYHCPFCNHHKPKLEVNLTEKPRKLKIVKTFVIFNSFFEKAKFEIISKKDIFYVSVKLEGKQ